MTYLRMPAVFVAVTLSIGLGEAFGPSKRLNVLFFAADDLRYQLGTAGP